MNPSLRLANDLEGFLGTAARLALSNPLVWPDQMALVNVSLSQATGFFRTGVATDQFLLVSSEAVGPHRVPISYLARVLGWHVDSDRVVLALRGICRAHVESIGGSPESPDVVAMSLLPDHEAVPRSLDHENRCQEILEAAAHLMPGPLPLAVTSYLLDKVPLGALCDLISESILHEPTPTDRSGVEARSEEILKALRERRGRLQASGALEHGLPPFSRN